ncbi:uncharacterized protein LOC133196666 [Saccostrea echinata]|uniref:uncharacterized protein LOC133196666 n=1 Tax=Saccostrea echinata TaxID=191078 RepID=UPI002A83556C|nr:uncharacterized protein LOC133196666 [Saccostrea echinata]
MEGVNTSRLPPIVRFQVGGFATEREPPERSWARIRTCLIDNPRDSGQNKRQEVWSYHKKNRGVLRSLVKSLPNIPFRIGKNKKRRSQSDHELASKNEKSESFLPKISPVGIESPTRNGKIRPLGTVNRSDDIIPVGKQKSQKNLENSAIRFTSTDNVNSISPDHVKESRRTDDREKSEKSLSKIKSESRLPRLPVLKQPLSKSRVVSFSTNDLNNSPKIIDSRSDSPYSDASETSENSTKGFENVNYGHSSQHTTEPIQRSLLDIINGNHLSDARMMGERAKKERKTGTVETATFPGADVDKEWFEKVLGDKEIIDMSNYDNFARTPRTRPLGESMMKGQNVLSSSNYPEQKPQTVTSRSPLRVQFDLPSEEKSPVKPTNTAPVTKLAGEPIAGFQRTTNSPSYFPLFSRDGLPMRRIGGPSKNKQQSSKLKISFPNSEPVEDN